MLIDFDRLSLNRTIGKKSYSMEGGQTRVTSHGLDSRPILQVFPAQEAPFYSLHDLNRASSKSISC